MKVTIGGFMQGLSAVKGMNERVNEGPLPRSLGPAGWVLERFAAWRAKSVVPRQMELMETLSLGGRRQLMLVRCANERYLVGCSTDGVQSVVKVSIDDETIESSHAL